MASAVQMSLNVLVMQLTLQQLQGFLPGCSFTRPRSWPMSSESALLSKLGLVLPYSIKPLSCDLEPCNFWFHSSIHVATYIPA